jgi:hypothetical protein
MYSRKMLRDGTPLSEEKSLPRKERMWGEWSVWRMESSDSMARSSGAEGEETEADFTAKSRPSSRLRARETRAKEPWPRGD